MATNIVQTAGPDFATSGSGNSATADFASNPVAGRLVVMVFGGNKNSGTFTNPSGFTTPTNGSVANTDVSARVGYATGVDGGTLSWTGQAEGVLAFFEFDSPSGWTHRTCAQVNSGTSSVNTLSLNPGTSPVDGIAIAMIAFDSSTGSGGPLANSATIGFSNGYTLIGRYQEAAPYGGDAGGACFALGLKQLTSSDRTTNTVFTTDGGSDQCVMIIEVIDIPALDQTLTHGGKASDLAFGIAVISTGDVTVDADGIPSAEAFGSALISQVISPTGIPSGEAFGVADLSGAIRPNGIPSEEAFGSASVSPGDVTLTPSGIPTGLAFGAVTVLGSVIAPTGIPSSGAFGTASVTPGAVTISPAGIPSPLTFGPAIVSQIAIALTSEILVRPRPRTSYEVVWMSKIPQASGPPIFFAVDPIDWTDISYTEACSAIPTLSLSAPIAKISDAIRQRFRNPSEMATEIWVYRNGKIIFAGPLAGATIRGRDLNLTADGLMTYLNRMIITSDTVFKNVDQFTVVKSLIDTKQSASYGNFGLGTSNIGTSGINIDITYLKKEQNYVLPKILQLSNSANGFDIMIDPASRQVELYHPFMGIDRSSGPEAIVFDDKDLTDTNIVLSLSLQDLASDIHGVGTGTGPDGAESYSSTVSNNDLLTQYGRMDYGLSFRDISSQSQLDALVQSANQAREEPLWIPGVDARVTPNADLSTYNVGDTVFYHLHNDLDVQGAFRLLKRTVRVSGPGDETVTASFV